MKEFTQFDILTLSGPPRQRGRAHGEILRAKIQALIHTWKEWLATNTGEFSNQYIREMIAGTNFLPVIQRWTPGLLEEIQGISEGAGVDVNDIFAFQLQDEEWWYDQERKHGVTEPAQNCSSIGWQNSSPIVAQNMDMPDYLDGYQVIFRIVDPETDVESLVFSTAGLIALNGMNNHSIGIVCNHLDQLNHSRDGLPVAFVHRGVLEKKSFSDAKYFLETIQHATGQNYLLGGDGQIVDLECSVHQVVEYSQSETGDRICHTNHPIVNTDFRGSKPEVNSSDKDLNVSKNSRDNNSRIRFETIFHHLGELEIGQAGVEEAKRILQSHESGISPVCRHSKPGLPWMTLGTTIMDLTQHPTIHVCPGPPCSSIFTSLGF